MAELLERLQRALADRYSVEREIGAGGMATVYLATDVRHHRQVALKVLKPEIASTLGAGRFAREIEVAARLQHPNILPLLDSGEAAGFFFYVMPYVEGESLRDRLARGGELPIPDAVRILMEVADALSEAHAHGVVHRDIKPDNVMLRGRHALVTDFGVAKAVTEATGHQMLTSTGVALGTPAYMAPEQATADPHQDHRVDIYALGVLGYELLTGRAPYTATTAAEMLAAHVTAEPEPLERYRPTVAPALTAVVMKCLAKKPADRWQTAEEVVQHLEPLAAPSGGTTPTQTIPAEVARARRRVVATVTAAGLIVLFALATLAYPFLRTRPLTITVSGLTQVTSDPGVEFQPAISPDGSEVAYAAGPVRSPQLVIRSTVNVTGGEVRLSDTTLGPETLPVWSPDGQSVRFNGCPRKGAASGSACRWLEAGRLGGGTRAVALAAEGGSVAWSADGALIAFARGDTIFTATVTETATRRVAVHHKRGYTNLHSLAFSPDGRRIAYVDGNAAWLTSANTATSCIWLVDARGGEPQPVTTCDNLNVSPAWLDARHLLFVSDRDGPRAAYVVEVGPNGSRGEPRAIAGIADPHTISYSAESRRLAFAKFSVRANIWSYPLRRSGTLSIRDGRPVTSGAQLSEVGDVSPDGRWLAYTSDLGQRGRLRALHDVYRIPAGGGQPILVSVGLEGGEAPRWSADGRLIAFHTLPPPPQIAVARAEGGAATVLTSGAPWHLFPIWGATDHEILFGSKQTGRWATWRVVEDSATGRWHEPSELRELSELSCPTFMCVADAVRDGLLHVDTASIEQYARDGRRQWRRDLAPEGLTQLQPRSARYSRDGNAVYLVATHRDGRRGIWAIPIANGPARLVVASDDPSLAEGGYAVGRDRLYLTVTQYESDIWVATLKW